MSLSHHSKLPSTGPHFTIAQNTYGSSSSTTPTLASQIAKEKSLCIGPHTAKSPVPHKLSAVYWYIITHCHVTSEYIIFIYHFHSAFLFPFGSCFWVQEAAPTESLLNWQDYEGRTPLHFAVADGNEAVVDVLTSYEGCNVTAYDNLFRTPLHWAALLGEWKRRYPVCDLNAARLICSFSLVLLHKDSHYQICFML